MTTTFSSPSLKPRPSTWRDDYAEEISTDIDASQNLWFATSDELPIVKDGRRH